MAYSRFDSSSLNSVAGPPHPIGGLRHVSPLMALERPNTSSRKFVIAGSLSDGSAIVCLLRVFNDRPAEVSPSARGRFPDGVIGACCQRDLAYRDEVLTVVWHHRCHVVLCAGPTPVVAQHVEREVT